MNKKQFISKHGIDAYTYHNPIERTLAEESAMLTELDRWIDIECCQDYYDILDKAYQDECLEDAQVLIGDYHPKRDDQDALRNAIYDYDYDYSYEYEELVYKYEY